MSAKRTSRRSTKLEPPLRGRANLAKLRRLSEREIERSSPPELAGFPADFWNEAVVVEPATKEPISLRVDSDVLAWFKAQGPRYQSRMNAVLRSYVIAVRRRGKQSGAA